ncbi:MAG: glutathione S-transferase family protein [Pseudomonadota bacterium]
MSDQAPDFLVYGVPVSPFVRKVLATSIEKGVGFDIEPLNIMSPPEWFATISPMKRIPILRDRSIAPEGDHSSAEGTIADSSAICGYIEKKHPTPAVYPAAPFAYGRALYLEEYADTVLAPATGLGMFRPIFFNMAQGKAPDIEQAKKAWSQDLPPVLDFLEAQLGDAQYFAGVTLSIADIAITCCFMQGELVAKTPLDAWPALKAHHERMNARPSIAGPFKTAAGFIAKALPEPFDLT